MIIKDNQTTPKFDYWKFLSLFSIPTFFLDPGLRRGDDILVSVRPETPVLGRRQCPRQGNIPVYS